MPEYQGEVLVRFTGGLFGRTGLNRSVRLLLGPVMFRSGTLALVSTRGHRFALIPKVGTPDIPLDLQFLFHVHVCVTCGHNCHFPQCVVYGLSTNEQFGYRHLLLKFRC